MSDQQRTKIIGIIIIVLLVVASTAGVVALQDQPSTTTVSRPTSTSTSTTTESPVDTSTQSTTSTTNTPDTSTGYKDGTYSAVGGFDTPDGYEEIGVKLTIASGLISAVAIDDSSIYIRESFEYTERFIGSIDNAVIGKSIDSLSLRRVAGASLTTNGFNNALDTIKADAKV